MSDEQKPAFSPGASSKSVNALVLNLILPGLGTIVGGKPALGAGQIALFLVGIPLIFFFFLGLLVMAGAWIWGAITGFQMMSDSTKS